MARVALKPVGMELVSAVLEGVPKSEVGVEFQLLEGEKVKFGWTKVKLAANCHLVITLQNPGNSPLVLEKGEVVGWGTRGEEEPISVPSPYVPSDFSYTQLSSRRPALTSPSPRMVSPYQPPNPAPSYPLPSHVVPSFSVPPPPLGVIPHAIPKVPKIPLEPPAASKGPRSPPPPPPPPCKEPSRRMPAAPAGRDPRGPRHKKPLPGTWGASAYIDPLEQAHQGVTKMLVSDNIPLPRPPSPTVRPERESPPKPAGGKRRDPRLQAVRIEKKSSMPFSKKVLEDRGIVLPQGNPKYFAPGQHFSPMLDILPGSRQSKLWAAENREGFLTASPDTPTRIGGFRAEISLMDGRKTKPLPVEDAWNANADEGVNGNKHKSSEDKKKLKQEDRVRKIKIVKRKKMKRQSEDEKSHGKSNGKYDEKVSKKKKRKTNYIEDEKACVKVRALERKKNSESMARKFMDQVSGLSDVLPVKTTFDVHAQNKSNTKKCKTSEDMKNPEAFMDPKKTESAPKVDESRVLTNEDDLKDEFLSASMSKRSDSDSDDSEENHSLAERKAVSGLEKFKVKTESSKSLKNGSAINKEQVVAKKMKVKKPKVIVEKTTKPLKENKSIKKAEEESEDDNFINRNSNTCQRVCCTKFCGTYTNIVPNVVAVDDADIPFIQHVISNNIESNDKISCKACGERFSSERALFDHGMAAHQEGWSFSDACASLEEGKTPKGPFVCATCHETINTWLSLTKHLWQPHLFKCEYCSFAFNRNTKLEDHTNKTHNLVGLIEVTQCGLCGESFARSSSLARHVTAPHPFPCSLCEAKFQTKSALNKHGCSKGIAMAIINFCIDSIATRQ